MSCPMLGKLMYMYLITCCTSGPQCFRMVPSTENPSILVAVDQIHQKLFADRTNKARSMPTCVLTCSWSKNCHGSWADMITTLQENEPGLSQH